MPVTVGRATVSIVKLVPRQGFAYLVKQLPVLRTAFGSAGKRSLVTQHQAPHALGCTGKSTIRSAGETQRVIAHNQAFSRDAPHRELSWHAAAQGGPVPFVDAPGQLQLALRLPPTLPSMASTRSQES